MSNSRIPSPARSLGVISSPRRYKQRRSRSVCSPGRLETSFRLTAMISDTFVPSPLPKRRSVLNDDTEIIDMPKRKSWWRKLDENSRDVIELFEHKEVPETNNIEENFDVEILSQEKKNYTLDLPESSDGESISSIVIPQRKLFTQKENHPPKKFPRVFNNREELVKLQKSHVDHDKEIDVRPKSLFNQGKKPKIKPIFPSALLNISANKSIANKTREIPTEPKRLRTWPKGQVRNLFGNRLGTKRKNMFADFVVSESEDEVPEIQVKVFGFQKKSEQKRRISNAGGAENSPTASILDADMDDWKQLPSSTMMENQIEDLAATPAKRKRLSKFIEPKETASPNKSFNKTKCNESLQSHKPKLTSSPQNIEEDMEMNTSQIQKSNQSKTFNKTRTDAQLSKLGKTYDIDINEGAEGIQNKTLTGMDSTVDRKKVESTKINATKKTVDYHENQDPIQDGSDGENDFTLEYENDEDNLEQVENEREKVIKNSSEKIQSKKQNESSMHNRSSQSKIPKDIDKSNNNNSKTTLVNITNINISQNTNNGSKRHNSQVSSVNDEINNIKGSKNQSIETIVNKDDIRNKHENIDKNKTYNNADLVNKQNTENNSSNLVIQNQNSEESDAKKNKSIDEVNKSLLNLESSKTHNDVSEDSMRDDVENKDIQNEENEYSSDESIQLDESETHNESQESQNVEENENNESNNEINEAGNDTSEKVLSSNENEIEQVLDEVDNICENDNNLNKSDKNLERSKHNETKVDPPETILFQQSKNLIESFTGKGDGKSPRKTKSMLKNNLTSSLALVRESTGFSDNTANSSGANSGWDSHRTTRKTLRKTFGKDFTPRKSLRTLVMEKSAKQRQTFNPDLQDISKHPRANSTELPGHGMNELQEQFDDETVENIQQAIENNIFVKETPEGTENDIVDDDDHMESEETDNVNKSQKQSEAVKSHTQSEESNYENAESSDEEPNGNSKVKSGYDNDATENQQIGDKSDHANNTSDKDQTVEESDHENNDTENQQAEEESDHENDAIENQQSEEESERENDAIENQQSEEESDHENDARNQQFDEESDHANDTSNQQTDHESGHDLNEEETENQKVEESDNDQEHSDNDTRDNQFAESGYNNDEISENNIQENNTEIEQTVEESNHFSRSMKQRTLEMYLEKINKQELEREKKLRENLMNSLKTKDTHNFKVPVIPMRRKVKPVEKKVKAAPAKAMEVDDLPEEIKQDLKYKPPRRYQPKNASWATKRLYKYLETKLEPKYDYMARVRAEKLVNTLHEFTRHIKRHDTAPAHTVAALKQEMARLKIVDTHYDFYHFFNEFMPREIRVKVNPDIVNRIQLPRDVFSNIIR